jgi:hypothetical protein
MKKSASYLSMENLDLGEDAEAGEDSNESGDEEAKRGRVLEES